MKHDIAKATQTDGIEVSPQEEQKDLEQQAVEVEVDQDIPYDEIKVRSKRFINKDLQENNEISCKCRITPRS